MKDLEELEKLLKEFKTILGDEDSLEKLELKQKKDVEKVRKKINQETSKTRDRDFIVYFDDRNMICGGNVGCMLAGLNVFVSNLRKNGIPKSLIKDAILKEFD